MKFPEIREQIGDEVEITGRTFEAPYKRAVLTGVYPYHITLRVDFEGSRGRLSARPYSETVSISRANLLCGDIEVIRLVDGERLGTRNTKEAEKKEVAG